MKRLTFLGIPCSLRSVPFGKSAVALVLWFILLFGHPSYADPEWLANPVDNNWNNPANWSTGMVPLPTEAAHLGASTINRYRDPFRKRCL
jgi:hypothetical protein